MSMQALGGSAGALSSNGRRVGRTSAGGRLSCKAPQKPWICRCRRWAAAPARCRAAAGAAGARAQAVA